MTEDLGTLDGDGGLARLLLNSTGEGIYGVDLQGNCTFANPACVRLLGFESDADLLGRNMHELVHHTRPNGDPYPMVECKIYQAFRERRGIHVDDELIFCADGTAFPVEYWSYPVEKEGKLIGQSIAAVARLFLSLEDALDYLSITHTPDNPYPETDYAAVQFRLATAHQSHLS